MVSRHDLLGELEFTGNGYVRHGISFVGSRRRGCYSTVIIVKALERATPVAVSDALPGGNSRPTRRPRDGRRRDQRNVIWLTTAPNLLSVTAAFQLLVSCTRSKAFP